jgi:uncharacterized membrane protein
VSKGSAFRRHLIAGLVVIAPVGVTAFVLWWIFQWLDGLLGRFLYPLLPWRQIPGLGLLALVLILVAAGWATERAVGFRVIRWWHGVLERLPLTRRLYIASNRIVRTVFGRERHFLREVVLIEWPSAGRFSIGFLTGTAPASVQTRVVDAATVFIPTAPNPTSGFLVIVPRSDLVPLPWTTEEAFTYLLSAGSVTPDGDVPAASLYSLDDARPPA